jgi:predicted transposase YbfD/YdcC
MVVGQYATHVKSNEVTGNPKLLELPSLRGATVTLDAMGCQKRIAKVIVDKGADYIFGLKGNPPKLHAEVLEAFDDSRLARLSEDITSYVETADKGHGRNEVRRIGAWRDIGWLAPSDAWPGLRSLILVESAFAGAHAAELSVTRTGRNSGVARRGARLARVSHGAGAVSPSPSEGGPCHPSRCPGQPYVIANGAKSHARACGTRGALGRHGCTFGWR